MKTPITDLMQAVHADVMAERQRQNEKWGLQRHPMPVWLTIAAEEFGEVAQAIQTDSGWGKPTDADDLYTEWIHLAAVALAAAEQVKEARAGHEAGTRTHEG